MNEHVQRGWLRPIDARLALALLVTMSGGGYAVMHGQHENDAMTTQQAQQIGGMRTLIENANQHCTELRLQDLRDDFKGVRDAH